MKILKICVFFWLLCTGNGILGMDPDFVPRSDTYYEEIDKYEELLKNLNSLCRLRLLPANPECIITMKEYEAYLKAFTVCSFLELFLLSTHDKFSTKNDENHKFLLSLLVKFNNATKELRSINAKIPKNNAESYEIDEYLKNKKICLDGSNYLSLWITNEKYILTQIINNAFRGGITQISGASMLGFSTTDDTRRLNDFVFKFGLEYAEIYALSKSVMLCKNLEEKAFNGLYNMLVSKLDNFLAQIISVSNTDKNCVEKFCACGFSYDDIFKDNIQKCTGSEFNQTNFPKCGQFLKTIFTEQKAKILNTISSSTTTTATSTIPTTKSSFCNVPCTIALLGGGAAVLGGVGYLCTKKNKNRKVNDRKNNKQIKMQNEEEEEV